MNLPGLSALFSTDLAIDLGTANTLVFAKALSTPKRGKSKPWAAQPKK
jgi:hypothetical protein